MKAGYFFIMQSIKPAGFLIRFVAYLIDGLIISLATAGIRFIPAFSLSSFLNLGIFFDIPLTAVICYIIKSAYFIVLTYLTGQTIGKMALNIKVVGEKDKPSLFDIIFRETFGRFLSAAVLNIGYLMVIFDNNKQSLHDRLSDTLVIYCEKD